MSSLYRHAIRFSFEIVLIYRWIELICWGMCVCACWPARCMSIGSIQKLTVWCVCAVCSERVLSYNCIKVIPFQFSASLSRITISHIIYFFAENYTAQCVCAVVADHHVLCRCLCYLKSEHKHMNHLCVQNAAHNCSFAEWYCVPPSSSRFWCLHGIYGIHKIIITLTLHRIEAIKLLSIVHAIHKFISLSLCSVATYIFHEYTRLTQCVCGAVCVSGCLEREHCYSFKCTTTAASNSNSQLLLLLLLTLLLFVIAVERWRWWWRRWS